MSDYDDLRAHRLREGYHAVYHGAELPVPVLAIAEDFLGLAVEERPLADVSGLLYPAERRIVLNAGEPETRRRFTLAHELGHWVCQCLEGARQPVFCRAEEIGVDRRARALEREANIFAANLVMPETAVRTVWHGEAADAAASLGVSLEAMQWRAYSFGLLPEPPA